MQEPDGTMGVDPAPAPPHHSVPALLDEFRRLNGVHLSDAFALALTRRLCNELAAEGALEEIVYRGVRIVSEHGEGSNPTGPGR